MAHTNNSDDWGGQPYYPISSFYKQRFGEKVYKITVSAAQTCPNRDKNKGVGCIFCDDLGSAGSHLINHMPLREQILVNRERLRKRFRVNSFIVYFQPFTNTFNRLEQFMSDVQMAVAEEDILGIAFGTRPDCLPEEIFPFLKKIREKHYVSAELGVQSFFDHHLEFINRGHSVKQSIKAITALKEQSHINVGIHLIFGMPGETNDEIVETAKRINSLPVDNVKLHNLHVLEKTPLADMFRRGEFTPLDLETYAERVLLFLSHLSPKIAVQRLAAVAPRWDELVAPAWTKDRLKPTQLIIRKMKENSVRQGCLFRGIHFA